jgi:dTDP-glucose 4,6-dehydratase
MKEIKEILLTGSSGFAGSHMLKYLLENTSSFIYCPVTYTHGGHPNRVASLIGDYEKKRYSVFEHDLAKDSLIKLPILSDIDLIINYASESHVDRSISDPIAFITNNSDLMINILEFARARPHRRALVHISTDEVYGALAKTVENKEWEFPHYPSNPYSASKSAQESLASAYFKTYEIRLAVINANNMMGFTQNQEKFIPKVITSVLQKNEINVDTDGFNRIGTRKYVHASDMAAAVYLVSKRLKIISNFQNINLPKPMKYHVSGSEEISNLDMVIKIGKILGEIPNYLVSPSPRKGYDLRYELDSSKIRGLGWEQSQTFDHALEEIVRWTVANPEWLFNDYFK